MDQPLSDRTLYIVATPIGNHEDMSPRARFVLSHADCVAAEDTRTSGAFLGSLGVKTHLLSLHEHNEQQRIPQLIARLEMGESLALISDAGTPLISDPGFALVRAVRQAGFDVVCVPGPCAAIAALSVSGLPTDRFFFAGFLAAKSAARRSQFEALSSSGATLVFYVSKRQVGEALAEARDIYGPARPAALCRELTKLHETTVSGTLEELVAAWGQAEQRGEFVLVIGGNPRPQRDSELDSTLDVLLTRLSTKDAAAVAAQLLGVAKRDAYSAALSRGGRRDDPDSA